MTRKFNFVLFFFIHRQQSFVSVFNNIYSLYYAFENLGSTQVFVSGSGRVNFSIVIVVGRAFYDEQDKFTASVSGFVCFYSRNNECMDRTLDLMINNDSSCFRYYLVERLFVTESLAGAFAGVVNEFSNWLFLFINAFELVKKVYLTTNQ